MIIVHHLEASRSQRVLWLLEELGLPYEIKHYKRDPRTRLAPPELKQVHPLGKSPVITDGDLVLAESGAILEYLAETYCTQATGEAANLLAALSRMSGTEIQLPNCRFHSSSERHQAGLPAMTCPPHSGKPQASSASFTSRAKGRNCRRSASACSPDAAAKTMPLS